MKNLIGIGVDIVDHTRIKEKQNMWERFLTKTELDALNNIEEEDRRVSWVAGRWSAKEAVIKAAQGEKISYQDIEVLPAKNDNPKVIVKGKEDFLVSISHEKTQSIAFATRRGK